MQRRRSVHWMRSSLRRVVLRAWLMQTSKFNLFTTGNAVAGKKVNILFSFRFANYLDSHNLWIATFVAWGWNQARGKMVWNGMICVMAVRHTMLYWGSHRLAPPLAAPPNPNHRIVLRLPEFWLHSVFCRGMRNVSAACGSKDSIKGCAFGMSFWWSRVHAMVGIPSDSQWRFISACFCLVLVVEFLSFIYRCVFQVVFLFECVVRFWWSISMIVFLVVYCWLSISGWLFLVFVFVCCFCCLFLVVKFWLSICGCLFLVIYVWLFMSGCLFLAPYRSIVVVSLHFSLSPSISPSLSSFKFHCVLEKA